MGGAADRACIATGVAQGIGCAIREALLGEGAKACFAGVNGQRVSDAAKANRSRLTGIAGLVTSAQVDPTGREQLRAMIARREDITGTPLFLGSKGSGCMTGRIVMIDGGMTLV